MYAAFKIPGPLALGHNIGRFLLRSLLLCVSVFVALLPAEDTFIGVCTLFKLRTASNPPSRSLGLASYLVALAVC